MSTRMENKLNPLSLDTVETQLSDTVGVQSEMDQEFVNEIVQAVQSFLDRQIDQFADMLAACKNDPSTAHPVNDDVQTLAASLQRQQQQFEAEKLAEIRRLEHANEKLIKAWNDLENEKRNMVMQNKLRQRQSPVSPLPDQVNLNQPTETNVFYSNQESPLKSQQKLTTAAQIELIKRQMRLHATRSPLD
jgi:hypothetical protein